MRRTQLAAQHTLVDEPRQDKVGARGCRSDGRAHEHDRGDDCSGKERDAQPGWSGQVKGDPRQRRGGPGAGFCRRHQGDKKERDRGGDQQAEGANEPRRPLEIPDPGLLEVERDVFQGVGASERGQRVSESGRQKHHRENRRGARVPRAAGSAGGQ